MKIFEKMKRLILTGFLCCFCIWGQSQEYKIVGAYKGLTAQGMAIYGDRAFLLNNTGYCRVVDLKKRNLLWEYSLASSSKTNHANCASFGREFYKDNTIPLMYVSECSAPYRCFVENIVEGSSRIVQTIQAIEGGMPKKTHDWMVDDKGKYMYTFTRLGIKDSNGEIRHRIVKYRKPSLNEGEDIFLSEGDVLDQFEVSFLNMGQGGTIKGNKMYLPVGLAASNDGKRNDSERALIVVNLKKRKIVKKILLPQNISDEPEDVSFYGKSLFLFCGQGGGLWKLDLKSDKQKMK